MQFLLTACTTGTVSISWEELKQEIREAAPDVDQISVDEFYHSSNESILIIDVREPEEYAVSHIKGAINSQDAEEIVYLADGYEKVLLYCSVGYRSALMANQIQSSGFDGVLNLEGSIFEWANSGFPLYQGENPASYVHPYDKKWGTYLNSELRFPDL